MGYIFSFFTKEACAVGTHYKRLTDKKNEPAYHKTYNQTCATSEISDQPAHPHSLVRFFADRMYLLQSPSYPERDK